jgi:soluble lytic murein transglycosylase-like protein
MSLNFIQKRMAYLDTYMQSIDSSLAQKITANTKVEKKDSIGFENILNEKLKPQETFETQKPIATKVLKGKVIKDDFSKLPDDFEEFIEQTAKELSSEYDVKIDSNLVRSVIKQESGFNPNAKSHAGAQGLMQLMPTTAKSLGVFNSSNPYQNVRGGITYLAKQLKNFDGNIQKALAAYNAGPGAVEKYNGIPPYQETQHYVENIMRDYLARENYQPIDMIG